MIAPTSVEVALGWMKASGLKNLWFIGGRGFSLMKLV
jgi:hypothetical protein